nr:prolyl oligopeptidase family serine peptidase [Actinoplanes lichenis]
MEHPRSSPAVTVGTDGARVAFLHAAALRVMTVATGELTTVAEGVEAFAGSADLSVLTWARDGRLESSGASFTATGPVVGPRPDPAGHNVGWTTPDGTLRVTGPGLPDQLLAGEPGSGVTWGVADPAAGWFGRTRGWWWSPDGSQILAARHAAGVSLHLLDLYGGWVDVHWDRETYPYLAGVRWTAGHPLITVLRRSQQHGLVLSVDPRTGETQVHAELADARWVEPVAGTPLLLPDGRVVIGGELAHDGFDARCLFADGSLLTQPELYVRRVAGVLADTHELIVEASEGDPAEHHVFAIRTTTGGSGARTRRLTSGPGRHQAFVGGDVLVVDGVVRRGAAEVPLFPVPAPSSPRPILDRVTDRRLPTGVLYPPGHVTGTPLPVLVELGDGPGHQQVVADPAAWADRQRWADAGFAVVSVDSRGTPGVAPSFEKVVHRRLADVALTDQVEALHALTGKHPDLDLTRVAARGTGLGGWLAILAVQRRPAVFRRGIALDPVLDWADLPPVLAERYLGSRTDNPEIYEHHAVAPPGPELLLSPAGGLWKELEFLREPS